MKPRKLKLLINNPDYILQKNNISMFGVSFGKDLFNVNCTHEL